MKSALRSEIILDMSQTKLANVEDAEKLLNEGVLKATKELAFSDLPASASSSLVSSEIPLSLFSSLKIPYPS